MHGLNIPGCHAHAGRVHALHGAIRWPACSPVGWAWHPRPVTRQNPVSLPARTSTRSGTAHA